MWVMIHISIGNLHRNVKEVEQILSASGRLARTIDLLIYRDNDITSGGYLHGSEFCLLVEYLIF